MPALGRDDVRGTAAPLHLRDAQPGPRPDHADHALGWKRHIGSGDVAQMLGRSGGDGVRDRREIVEQQAAIDTERGRQLRAVDRPVVVGQRQDVAVDRTRDRDGGGAR